jgi:hypothetical protein
VERYVPAVDARSIAAIVRQLPEAPGGARHVGTLVITNEETCLSVFEATDAPSVAAVNEAAGLPLDRIVEAEWIPGSPA